MRNLNVIIETIQVLGENISEFLFNLSVGKHLKNVKYI